MVHLSMNKFNTLLLLLVLGFGIGVVFVQNETRELHSQLNLAQKEAEHLKQERAGLILLQAKHSNHVVIKEAAEKLNLHTPNVKDTQIIEVAK
jgi:cell division protein FtsL